MISAPESKVVKSAIDDVVSRVEGRQASAAMKVIVGILATAIVSGGGAIIYRSFNTEARVSVIEMQKDSFVNREELSPIQQSIVGLEKDVGHMKEEQTKMYSVQQQMLSLQTDSLRQQERTQVMLEDIRRTQNINAAPAGKSR